MIGKIVHHYKILEELGIGGMGSVYKAQDTKLNRMVALKFLAPHLSRNENEKKRFIHEARAISGLDHPNICNIFDIDETDDGQMYIVMACYNGKSLKDLIKEKHLPIDQVVDIALQIAEGLEAAHSKDIIHRDIKPANVLITNEGKVKIVDFGLAKLVGGNTTLTKEGSTLGTIAYMSPEQTKGTDIDKRTDIWAFGVVLYEMLTGELPFKGEYDQAVIYSILNELPTPIENYNEKCPATLAKIVSRCLTKNRHERYQNISEVINDLQLAGVDTDYRLRTKTVRIRQGWYKLNTKKIPTIIAAVITVIVLSFLLPEVWQKFKDFVGWNSVPEEQHLVILPLINIGGDSTRKAFCEGLMETLSSNITQIEQFRNSLWVVPASEVIKDNIRSASEAHKKYGVNLAVTGSVQFIGDLLKLNLNLIDAKELRQLNSSIINVNTKDISIIDNKAVIKLLEMLHVEIDPQLSNVLETGKTNDPDSYEYYVQGIGRLQQYQNRNNLEEAIRLLKLATQVDSNYALAYAGLGEAYWRYYNFTKDFSLVSLAKNAANKGYALDSTLASTNITLGMIYNGTGRYHEAVIHFKKALASEPSNAAAYRLLAKTYQSLNRNADAEATFKEAIKLKPDYWAGYNDLGVFYYSQGRFDEAIGQFKEVIRCTPDNYRGYMNLATMYFSQGQFSKAKDMYSKSLEVQPNYNSYSNLGVLYSKEGNFDKAAQFYQKALDLNDNDYLMWANLASAQHFIPGKGKESIKSYKKAIRIAEEQMQINPNDPDVISNLAAYYGDIDDSTKAFEMLHKALKIDPDNSRVLYRAASINEHFKNREKALYWIKKTIMKGYSKTEIEQDLELKQLVSDERYKQIVEELNKGKSN